MRSHLHDLVVAINLGQKTVSKKIGALVYVRPVYGRGFSSRSLSRTRKDTARTPLYHHCVTPMMMIIIIIRVLLLNKKSNR